MPVHIALIVVAALIALTCATGLLLRRRASAARSSTITGLSDDVVAPAHRGSRATLVLFSTEFCGQCPGVRRSLTAISAETDGVTQADVDLTNNAALAEELRILQTPTVFILDASGAVAARFSGATPRTAVEAELARITEAVLV